MTDPWQQITLGDLVDEGFVEIRTGPFGTQLHASDYSDNGVPVLNVRNLGFGALRQAEIERVGNEVQARLSGHLLKEGDVVFGRKGAVDRHLLVGPHQSGWMQGSDCIRLRILPDSPVSPTFLSKALLTESHRTWMEAQCSHGATMASLNQEIIRRISLDVPRKALQRRIAAVLGAFDELIEINERRIELLEDLARSLYREWFVHFRFPGHEDAELVDSELGPIPEGWEARKLKDIVTLDKGLSYKGAHLTEVGPPMANLKCLAPSGGFRRGGTKPYSGAFKPRQAVSPGDLIVANTDLTQAGNVIGSPAIVPARTYTGGGLISHHLFAVRSLGPETVPFLFQMLAHEAFRAFARSRASGTTVLGLRADDALEFRFVAPPVRLRGAFNAIAAALHQQAEALLDLNEDLVATRDHLLPRLVTGRLDISDIDLGVLTPTEVE